MPSISVVPHFNVRWQQSPNPSSNYVGLNVQFFCQTAFLNQLRGVSVNLVISGPAGRMLSNTTDGRIVLHETRGFGNGDFERIVKFLPLSSSDMGTYSCTGTATPVISNSFVTGGSNGSRSKIIDVFSKCPSVWCMLSYFVLCYLMCVLLLHLFVCVRAHACSHKHLSTCILIFCKARAA